MTVLSNYEINQEIAKVKEIIRKNIDKIDDHFIEIKNPINIFKCKIKLKKGDKVPQLFEKSTEEIMMKLRKQKEDEEKAYLSISREHRYRI